MIKKLMKLTTQHPDSVSPDREWLCQAKQSIFCPECEDIDRRKYPQPCDVILHEYPGYRIEGGVSRAGISIFHVDFFIQIVKYLRDYSVGHCYLNDGTQLDEYVTCYTNNFIVQRGGPKTRYYVCHTCGRISYDWWFGKQYVLRCYLNDALAYMDGNCNIFVAEELYKDLDYSAWPDASWEPIAVRDTPKDGFRLPIDPLDAPWQTVPHGHSPKAYTDKRILRNIDQFTYELTWDYTPIKLKPDEIIECDLEQFYNSTKDFGINDQNIYPSHIDYFCHCLSKDCLSENTLPENLHIKLTDTINVLQKHLSSEHRDYITILVFINHLLHMAEGTGLVNSNSWTALSNLGSRLYESVLQVRKDKRDMDLDALAIREKYFPSID